MHEYRKNGGLRSNADFSLWIKNIIEQRVDLLFITRDLQTNTFPIEEEWAQDHLKIFSLEYSQENVHIWRVNRRELIRLFTPNS